MPDVPTETMALLPEESVSVAIWPTLAVESPGRIMPEEPAMAERVFVPKMAMAVGDVDVGVGWTVGVVLWRDCASLLWIVLPGVSDAKAWDAVEDTDIPPAALDSTGVLVASAGVEVLDAWSGAGEAATVAESYVEVYCTGMVDANNESTVGTAPGGSKTPTP